MVCKNINTCCKIAMILDKDMLDFQYAESIKVVCAKCKDKKDKGGW